MPYLGTTRPMGLYRHHQFRMKHRNSEGHHLKIVCYSVGVQVFPGYPEKPKQLEGKLLLESPHLNAPHITYKDIGVRMVKFRIEDLPNYIFSHKPSTSEIIEIAGALGGFVKIYNNYLICRSSSFITTFHGTLRLIPIRSVASRHLQCPDRPHRPAFCGTNLRCA
ncbi:hypothetical protein BDZ94DRAFT_1272486 [Collybia nuda]|uniref:Uncharacterized protein n=1 Tax=Collybia nuda TaxID=64659 RepID=A0A9P5XXZ0_9AGAR|nr:hypothetical protein BDZ94DRAFT_1272486 [Collybia nuda]